MINTILEYGLDFREPGALAIWTKITAPRDKAIPTREAYLRRVRQIARRRGVDLEGIDPRLVEAGWNVVAPGEWVAGGLRWFRQAWDLTVRRPGTVGSCYNPEPWRLLPWLALGLPGWAAVALAFALLPAPRRLTRAARRRRIDQARALARRSLPWLGVAGHCGADLLRRLGQLSAMEQWIAAIWFAEQKWPVGKKKIRVRDLDWAEIRRRWSGAERVKLIELAVERAGEYAAWRHAIGGLDYWSRDHWSRCLSEGARSAWLCPAYPKLPLEGAFRIAQGQTPAELSGGLLTRQEAHLWCKEGARQMPREWLQGNLLAGLVLPEGFQARSEHVLRWLGEVRRRGAWGQLLRDRRVVGPRQETLTFRFFDRLDEIQDEDLPRGIRTPVEEAFESVATRTARAWESQALDSVQPLTEPPPWRIFPRAMAWLLTTAELVREGQDQGHCVGGYAGAVASRRCVILALRVRVRGVVHRSTAELDPRTGYVFQHRGAENASPPAPCERVLRRFFQVNGMLDREADDVPW